MENKFKKMRTMVIFSVILIIFGLLLIVIPVFLKSFLFTQICFIALGELILIISGSIGGFLFLVGVILFIITLIILKKDGVLYEKYKLGTNINKKNINDSNSLTDNNQNINLNYKLDAIDTIQKENSSNDIDNSIFENIPVIDTNTYVTQTVDYISPEELYNQSIYEIKNNTDDNAVEIKNNQIENPHENNVVIPISREINVEKTYKKPSGKPTSKMFEHNY